MTTIRRTLATVAAAAAVATPIIGTDTPAQAAGRDGVCNPGEFCLYYNSNHQGSVSDFTGTIDNYGASQPSCYEFKGAGNGKGLCVKNNAASARNRTDKPVTIYYNSGHAGKSQTLKPGEAVNLTADLKNNNASHRIGNPPTSGKMSTALYKNSGGRLTTGFDGYTTTPGRHEGIDFALRKGAPVYSLVEGTVTYINENSNLSTLSIYNKKTNKTVILIHTDPLNSLRVGQNIKRGQHVAYESDRGAGSAVHTHVEMRPGRQTHASKSVNDPVLDNPNPTSFWTGLGYSVQ